MDKKQVIVQEIEKWRESKLLPEQYCDFLLNLYLEQPVAREEVATSTIRTSLLNKPNRLIWMMIFLSFPFLSLFAYYFNAFSMTMQMAISGVIIALLYLFSILVKSRSQIASFLTFGLGSIVLILVGSYFFKHYDLSLQAFAFFIICSSLIWMVLGFIAKTGLFHFCGWAGLLLTYSWFIYFYFGDVGLLQLQLHWVPLSVIFIGLTNSLHEVHQPLSRVFFVLSNLLFIVPELFQIIVYTVINSLNVGLIAGKLIILVALLYVYRKRWMEWVM